MVKSSKIFRNFDISKKWLIFQILKIDFQIYRKFLKNLPLFEKKSHFFQNLKISRFSYISEKKYHFFKNHAKVQKNFRNFEISKKMRIFQILKINFQIYRKFQKKIYHFFKNIKIFKFSYIFEKKNITFSKIENLKISYILKKN